MTMAMSPATVLSSPELRRGLAALLRRRVPAHEVADLMQTVLCDALASARLPEDPDEVAKWVSGIARHKVADYRRRTGRTDVAPSACASEIARADEPAPFEAREILGEVLSVSQRPRDRETLEWIVREHEGEALSVIAAEEGLASPAVRKRVSRLRRLLRARFAVPATFVALFALALAGGFGGRVVSDDPLVQITAEPNSAFPAGLAGDFRVVSHTLSQSTPTATRAVVERELAGATIVIGATTVELHGSSTTLVRTVANVKRMPNGEVRAELRDAKGRVTHVTARSVGRTLEVTVEDGSARGVLTLARK